MSAPAPSWELELRRRLGEAAHAINSPLSVIQLQLFLHKRSLRQPTPEDLHALDVLDRNVERIRDLVAGMMLDARQQPRPPDPQAPPG